MDQNSNKIADSETAVMGPFPQASCSTILRECMEHHQSQQKAHADCAISIRTAISEMDEYPENRPTWSTDWPKERAYNLRQADHDEKQMEMHGRFAKAIADILSNAELSNSREGDANVR
jgi:hypothetical protein